MTNKHLFSTQTMVIPSSLAIPAGIKKSGQLRLGIQLSPFVPEKNVEKYNPDNYIELSSWPSVIFKKLCDIKVYLHKYEDDHAPTQINLNSSFNTYLKNMEKHNVLRNNIWKAVFHDDKYYENLITALKWRGNVSNQNFTTPKSKPEFNLYQTANFIDYFNAFSSGKPLKGWLLEKVAKKSYDIATKTLKDYAEELSELNANNEELTTETIMQALDDLKDLNINKNNKIAEDLAEFEINKRNQSEETAISNLLNSNGYRFIVSDFCKATLGHFVHQKNTMKENSSDGLDTPESHAFRKYVAILQHPSLAYFLGFGVNLTIDKEQLAGYSEGFIEVRLEESVEQDKTAFNLDEGSFFPQPDDKELYKEGYLNLGVKKQDGNDRFQLTSKTPLVDMARLVQLGQILNSNKDNSVEDEKLRPKERGITLLDRCITESTINKLQFEVKELGDENPKYNYLEDLVIGIRPDIQSTFKIGKESQDLETEKTFQSVTQREIIISDLEEVYNKLPEEFNYILSHQDDGFVPWQSAQNEQQMRIDINNELFNWTGSSMATSYQPDSVKECKSKDLGIQREYNLPKIKSEADSLPPLRVGQKYGCGTRVVLPLGLGPTLDEARAFYANNKEMTIQDESKLADFCGHEIPSPDIHFDWKDKSLLVPEKPSLKYPGESLETIVVGDDIDRRRSRRKRRRFITPPRIGFTEAEYEGQFSGKKNATGAFEKKDEKIWLFGKEATFPEARLGKGNDRGPIRMRVTKNIDSEDEVFYMQAPVSDRPDKTFTEKEFSQLEGSQSRGSVLIYGNENKELMKAYDNIKLIDEESFEESVSDIEPYGRGFFTSINARSVKCQLERFDGKQFNEIPGACTIRHFWRDGNNDAAEDARPLLLDVRPAERNDYSNVGFDDDDDYVITPVNVSDDSKRKKLPYLKVYVPEGKRIWLNMTATVDTQCDVTKSEHENKVPKTLRVEIVHAVKKPMLAPKYFDKSKNKVYIHATHEPTGESGAVTEMLEAWNQEPKQVSSTTYFYGKVFSVDKNSTSNIRVKARWYEKTTDTYKYDELSRLWVEKNTRPELDIFEIPVGESKDESSSKQAEETGVKTTIELAPDTAYDFADGRARRLTLQLNAASSFINYFEAKRFQDLDDGTKPDLEFISDYVRSSGDFGDAADIWVKSTMEPPVPKIRQILPVFNWSDKKEYGKVLKSVQRKNSLYICVDDHFATGEGEKLGIVLIDPDHAPKKIKDYDNKQFKPFKDLITRPAGAAYELSHLGGIGLYSKPEDFFGIGGEEVKKTLTIKLNNDDNSPKLKVLIMLLKMGFSEELGPYFELPINNSSLEFLHLGLVRYQPHAIDGKKVSIPISEKAKIPATYDIKIRDEGVNSFRSLTITRPSFTNYSQEVNIVPNYNLHLFKWIPQNRSRYNSAYWKKEKDEYVGEAKLSADLKSFIFKANLNIHSNGRDERLVLLEETITRPKDSFTEIDINNEKQSQTTFQALIRFKP